MGRVGLMTSQKTKSGSVRNFPCTPASCIVDPPLEWWTRLTHDAPKILNITYTNKRDRPRGCTSIRYTESDDTPVSARRSINEQLSLPPIIHTSITRAHHAATIPRTSIDAKDLDESSKSPTSLYHIVAKQPAEAAGSSGSHTVPLTLAHVHFRPKVYTARWRRWASTWVARQRVYDRKRSRGDVY